MLSIKKKSKKLFIIAGFLVFFIITLIGITIEDLIHEIPQKVSLQQIHHYYSPLIMAIIGGFIANFICNIYNKQEKTFAKLLNAEKKFRNYINTAGDAIYLHDANGNLLDCNNEVFRELGYSKNELSNIHIKNIDCNFKSFSNYHQLLSNIKPGHSFTLESIHKRKDGSTFPVEIKVCRINTEEATNYISIIRNITERKTAEMELAQSKNKFQVLYENAPLAYQSLNNKGLFIDINPAWTETFGYHYNEVIGRHFTSFMTQSSKEKMPDVFNKFVKTGTVKNEIFELNCKNGKTLTVSVNGKLSNANSSTNLKTHCILIDITKQITIQKALEESELRFKMLSNLTFEGIVILKNNLVYEANFAITKITGYSIDEIKESCFLENLVSKKYLNFLNQNLSWEISPPFEIEIIKKDNARMFVEIEASNIHINNLVYKVVAIRNIAKRKETEKQLNTFFTAVEQSANHIVITQPDGKIIYANNKFYQITGFKHNEIIGKTPQILKSGKHTQDFYKEMWDTINSKNVWNGEICNKNKNGKLFWENTIITPILNDGGDITNFIAIKEDITEKKQRKKNLFNTIIETEEKERKRFAENLHDELGPFLSGIKLYVNELGFDDLDKNKRLSMVKYLQDLIDEAVKKTRMISHQLMPNVLFDFGLKVALESFCEKINITNKIKVNLKIDITKPEIEKSIEVVIYRICIELINNTIKHAQASEINIRLITENDILIFSYNDNGIGFNYEEKLIENSGLGLTNIKSRIESINGSFYFEKLKEKGILYKFVISL